ncbi:hypothetical protein LG201_04525 [Methylobacillus gramineus]|uniref:hypothetical protein n=1 Tax=Methylobacillus gramineus TaxID=755169 RepID=UPI001CFF9F34|nr:hypothetical protein [Methylobacillus gramineus]MCB5184462.1 hypothetical protein [Methylobacillus gramineus]
MSSLTEHLANPETVKKASEISTVLGSFISFFTGLTLNDWGVIVGIALGVGGGIFGAVLKRREHALVVQKLEAELSEIADRQKYRRQAAEGQHPYFYPSPELKVMEAPYES